MFNFLLNVAVLLHLLQSIIKATEQTMIFAATKHHVEYLKTVRNLVIELAIFACL